MIKSVRIRRPDPDRIDDWARLPVVPRDVEVKDLSTQRIMAALVCAVRVASISKDGEVICELQTNPSLQYDDPDHGMDGEHKYKRRRFELEDGLQELFVHFPPIVDGVYYVLVRPNRMRPPPPNGQFAGAGHVRPIVEAQYNFKRGRELELKKYDSCREFLALPFFQRWKLKVFGGVGVPSELEWAAYGRVMRRIDGLVRSYRSDKLDRDARVIVENDLRNQGADKVSPNADALRAACEKAVRTMRDERVSYVSLHGPDVVSTAIVNAIGAPCESLFRARIGNSPEMREFFARRGKDPGPTTRVAGRGDE